jgi:hypothetical protein
MTLRLSASPRPDSAYAFPQQRNEPLSSASHVRNALRRFDQVTEVGDADRALAFENIRLAASYFDVHLTEKSWHDLMPQRAATDASSGGSCYQSGAAARPIFPALATPARAEFAVMKPAQLMRVVIQLVGGPQHLLIVTAVIARGSFFLGPLTDNVQLLPTQLDDFGQYLFQIHRFPFAGHAVRYARSQAENVPAITAPPCSLT